MPHYSDPRTDEMKREMAETFAEFEADYRDADWCSVVCEDRERVIIADHKGYEFGEWADKFGGTFGRAMHTIAKDSTDHNWSADYPVVFDKLE